MDWKRWSHVTAAAAACIAIGTAIMPILHSDASPWASVLRVESVRSEILSMHITITVRSYCEAERMHNVPAATAASEDIENLEQQYARLNDGRELPLRPCP